MQKDGARTEMFIDEYAEGHMSVYSENGLGKGEEVGGWEKDKGRKGGKEKGKKKKRRGKIKK